jgi:hypothetical protein
MKRLAVPTPSRASSAPTGFVVFTKFVASEYLVGAELARDGGVTGDYNFPASHSKNTE